MFNVDLIRAQDPGHSPNFDSSSSSSSIFCPNPLTFLFPHRLKYGAFSEGLAFTSAAGDSSKTSKIHGRIYKNCAFKMSYILYLPLHEQHCCNIHLHIRNPHLQHQQAQHVSLHYSRFCKKSFRHKIIKCF